MTKQQLLNKLEQAWLAFKESYAGLPAELLIDPGVTGDWSVKDILAHVSWWEQEALKHLPPILQGGRPPRYSGRCRRLTPEDVAARRAEGRPATLRFRVAEGARVAFEDAVRGRQEFATGAIGAFVIRRSDGSPAFC